MKRRGFLAAVGLTAGSVGAKKVPEVKCPKCKGTGRVPKIKISEKHDYSDPFIERSEMISVEYEPCPVCGGQNPEE